MILEDFHVHTTFCDGNNSPEEMVLAAIEKKMTRIGFSVHSYTSFDDGFCIPFEKLSSYKAHIRELAEKYADKIQILYGVEQDYYADFDTSDFDYAILSVHYIKKDGIYYPVDHSPEYFARLLDAYNGDFIALSRDYYETVGDCLNKFDGDIIGHFDLVTKFNENNRFFDMTDPEYLDLAKGAIDKLLPYNKPFEINTGAITRGYRSKAYPHPALLDYIFKKGGKVILSSDSHSKDTLCNHFEEYEEFAKTLGFSNLVFNK